MSLTTQKLTSIKLNDIHFNGFIFQKNILFEMPLRDAFVEMNNITFKNCIFKNSVFLRDIYSQFDTPYKKIKVTDLIIEGSEFFQSSLFIFKNVNMFELTNLVIKSSNFIVDDTSVMALIDCNVLKFTNIYLQDNMFMGMYFIR